MGSVRALLPYLTIGRFKNAVRFRRDLKKRPLATSSFPPLIHIQPSGFCNTHCQLCPVGLDVEGPGRGFMHGDVFRKVIEQVRPYVLRINFGDWGEPLTHPHLFDMLAIARDNRIATSMSTNLHKLRTEKHLRRLATEGPTWHINLSLHGVSQETYEAYQPGRDYHTTIGKIRTLIRIRKKLGITQPTLALVFVITKKNQHEIPAMKQMAADLGVACRMYTGSINARLYEDQREILELVDTWAQDSGWEQFDNFDYVNKIRIEAFYKAVRESGGVDAESLEQQKLTGRHFCDEPWRSMTVNWNGTVCLCCSDYTKYHMGDVQKTPLPDIWNGPQYQDVRAYFHHKRDEMPAGHPCVHCIPY
jgi:MoaA/NifB/PqqE/SkfB family radical SAM enzyme